MNNFRLYFACLLTLLWSCGERSGKENAAQGTDALSDPVVRLAQHLDKPDSCRKAIAYLDSAAKANDQCFLCYYNQLMFFSALQDYDGALKVINECQRIRPGAYDLYLMGGFLYQKKGDSLLAVTNFQRSLAIINDILDTTKTQALNYVQLVTHKALSLVMLGDQQGGNELLQRLADNEKDTVLKEGILALMYKSKKELTERMIAAPAQKASNGE